MGMVAPSGPNSPDCDPNTKPNPPHHTIVAQTHRPNTHIIQLFPYILLTRLCKRTLIITTNGLKKTSTVIVFLLSSPLPNK